MRIHFPQLRSAAFASLLTLAFTANAAWPDKPIHIVIPYTPGGASDTVTRLIGQKLTEAWGQPVIIEYKPGADTQIGAELIAKSVPDGYTLGVFTPAIVINKFAYPKANYDLMRDMKPVAGLVAMPAALVVNSNFEAKTLKEFLALAKRKPKSLTFSTSSSNSYVEAEAFHRAAGIQGAQIPYRGSGASVMAVVSGEVTYTIDVFPNLNGMVDAGKLRVLGVTTRERRSETPDIPTLGEFAPGYEFASWFLLLAPTGVPAEIVVKINQQVIKTLAMPDVKAKLEALSTMPLPLSPEAATAMLNEELAKTGNALKNWDFSQKN